MEVQKAHQDGHINIPVYLSIGQDHIPAVVSELCEGWPLFPQHRCHSWCLSWGMSPAGIAKELLGRTDGCNKGMGGSASLASPEHKVFGHSGMLGDQVPIGVGYAQASQQPTVVVMGDAAAEEDYVLASLGYAATKNVPVLFICEDNNLSILTRKKVRRSWSLVNIAQSFGLEALNIEDNINTIWHTINDIRKLPVLININTHRHFWHAGSGQDEEPKYDEFVNYSNYTKEHDLINRNTTGGVNYIKWQIDNRMKHVWKQLLKQ